jgi:hypothetical protein
MTPKTYTVWIPFHTGLAIDVQADNEDDAIALAKHQLDSNPLTPAQQADILDNCQPDGSYEVVGD